MSDLDIKNLPEEYTTTVYLSWNTEYEWTNVYEYPVDDDPNRILIADPVEVTFKMKPREESVSQAVDELRREIEKVRAAAEVKCNQIEGKIQNLMALPNLGDKS